jgi:hypothetical protein
MDQRVDNERQPDSERLESPGRRAPPSFDEAGDKGSWRKRFPKRRRFIQLLVIAGSLPLRFSSAGGCMPAIMNRPTMHSSKR